ncbi:MAG: phosphoribosylanthranilate isomerase [Gammaproteobacteria bacterium]|nr:phosphoribosylanthranilate isomerase [Gammaproteobacteria bacterium]
MSKLWIKICGITRQQDAMAVAEAGASALGLVFYQPSPRSVVTENMSSILEGLPDGIQVIALFVDPAADEVSGVVSTGLVDCLQFHGDESATFCGSFGLPYMKAIRVGAGLDLASAFDRYESAAMILLDRYDERVPGGTGMSFNWTEAEQIARTHGQKLVVAGGLHPDNVQQAVLRLKPFGVDVSSGVEAQPGIKDPDKIKSFIEGARSV